MVNKNMYRYIVQVNNIAKKKNQKNDCGEIRTH